LYSTLQRAGITTLGHPAAYYGLGLTIGNGEVRLLELANAYATLARLGVYKPFRLLKTVGMSSRSSVTVGTSSCSSEALLPLRGRDGLLPRSGYTEQPRALAPGYA
jgi:membrane carboxypeptidase/penicillin-binding protein PbpC